MLTAITDNLFAERHGQAPARVIALPGWMRQRSDFRVVLGGLDALAIDLPGFGGASPEPAAAGGAALYADLVEPALVAAVDRLVLVGHSFGGRVAVHLAARHPDRVRGLVLSGVPLLQRDDRPPPTVSAVHRVARWANRRGLLSDERMEQRRRRRGSADYRNASGIMRAVLVHVVNDDYRIQLQAIARAQTAVELVWGSDDREAPLRTAERAAEILGTRTSVHVVPGAGHLLPLEAPGELRSSIDRLLAE